ncbi:hypothetical protein SY83_10880 [Paenibacillus swuensis]|uniref:Copper amine oxidase-like N-terminal domain-containing protein n=1 Tax=Paenibacillus swuensis TaxID=1178515 RepID=A0A172TIA0_9BACL|nr:hypothetical protein [Paenibacillus swuensis]ANE46692.1 hypothetical protein SY83_10880 [Paenibacillus swuensis]
MRTKSLIIMALTLLFYVLMASYAGAAGSVLKLKPGKITAVNPKSKSVTVAFTAKERQTYTVSSRTRLLVNGVAVPFNVFRTGMNVQVSLRDGQFTQLQGFTRQEKAVIPKASKYRNGTVTAVEGNRVWVQRSFGEIEDYQVVSSTAVLKNGKRADLAALYAGDRVKLLLNDIRSKNLAQLEIQTQSVELSNVYKGKLQNFDKLNNTITLTHVEVLSDGMWKTFKPLLTLDVDVEQSAYNGFTKVPWTEINTYADQPVYMATRMQMSREQVTKMLIQSAFEQIYTDRVSQTNFNTDTFTLIGSQHFTVHPGTLLIRNGRLVDQYSIRNAAHAYVSAADANQGFYPMANIIQIQNEGLEQERHMQDGMYWGTLDTLVEGRLFLKDFIALENHEWEFQHGGTQELFYDMDTRIYDLTKNLSVEPEEFDRQNYAIDDTSSAANYTKDWYGYMYVRDQRIVSIAVKQSVDAYHQFKTNSAKVVSVTGNSMNVENVREWNNTRDSWLTVSQVLNKIDADKAIIMKDGRKASLSDIQPGSNIYTVRNGSSAVFILIT